MRADLFLDSAYADEPAEHEAIAFIRELVELLITLALLPLRIARSIVGA